MPQSLTGASSRQSTARIHHIRSPLTRVGLSLPEGSAYLLRIAAGQVHLRDTAGGDRGTFDGPRLILRPEAADRELVAEGGTRASIVAMPALALAAALPTTPLGEQIRRTLGQDQSFPYAAGGQIDTLIQGLEMERAEAEPAAYVAAGHYLSLLLVQLWRLARADLAAHGRAPQGLAERFVLLAGQRLREHMAVGDYAQALGVSRDRLGTAVRRATGHSPQSYLHLLLIREASELLTNTGMPVGQIAFRLGFSDPAYFTRFFTRHRGESPARFRRTAKARREKGELSYAAWP
ncbi:helix-turn-helix domain-containing protein [Tropicimonas sediminicola]|uniref:Transcriptional regulator, AraC family n=1 Tax=Tropicimonas sediminicola TaxID=1031541 RepID=A0A239LI58_9RHOB|nr:helix-turn-helix domain-containing protein [Tropicimonas sediminicola]SNT30276.1 transcriptional regulator, AraC family [Tropicimonas sediminicola]